MAARVTQTSSAVEEAGTADRTTRTYRTHLLLFFGFSFSPLARAPHVESHFFSCCEDLDAAVRIRETFGNVGMGMGKSGVPRHLLSSRLPRHLHDERSEKIVQLTDESNKLYNELNVMVVAQTLDTVKHDIYRIFL